MILGEAQCAQLIHEIVVQQPEAAAAISGCMKNSRAHRLVLGIVPWSIELDHKSAWPDQADVVSLAGHAADTAALGWFIPAQSSWGVELSSKRIWPTSLTIGLIFEGSIICLLLELLFPFPLEVS